MMHATPPPVFMGSNPVLILQDLTLSLDGLPRMRHIAVFGCSNHAPIEIRDEHGNVLAEIRCKDGVVTVVP